jgi:uncharacterized membrane protein
MLVNALWLIPAFIAGAAVALIFFPRTVYVRTEKSTIDVAALRAARKETPDGTL